LGSAGATDVTRIAPGGWTQLIDQDFAGAGAAQSHFGSPADLLGRYDSQFPTPIAETHNGVVGLDSLLPPVLGAETYTGGLAYHHDGTIDRERAAWSVGAGWEGSFGHGPGPS